MGSLPWAKTVRGPSDHSSWPGDVFLRDSDNIFEWRLNWSNPAAWKYGLVDGDGHNFRSMGADRPATHMIQVMQKTCLAMYNPSKSPTLMEDAMWDAVLPTAPIGCS